MCRLIPSTQAGSDESSSDTYPAPPQIIDIYSSYKRWRYTSISTKYSPYAHTVLRTL